MSILTSKQYVDLINSTVAMKKEEPYLRIGQILFNKVRETNPDICDKVLNTENDPFEAKDWDDKRIKNFIQLLL